MNPALGNSAIEGDASEYRWRLAWTFLGFAGFAAAGISSLLRPDQGEITGFLTMLGALVIGVPVFVQAFHGRHIEGLEATKYFMHQLIALAVIACFAAERYVTGGLVAGILLLGEILETRSILGVREAVHGLMKLSRVRACRLRDGVEEIVDAEDLRPSDRLRIRPGDTIPADGRVVQGQSSVNQATITGEALPVEVEAGNDVFAGTSNLTGVLEVEVTKAGDHTVLGRVRQIVAEAQATRAPIMRLTEEYARYYAPLVLILGGLVLFFTHSIDRAVSVVIVSIPCAFVLAGPAAMVGALASASRLGMLIKSVRFLEVAAEIDTVVFDKTGTLTTGVLRVARIQTGGACSENELLRLTASVTRHSNHPVARAVVAEALSRGLILEEAAEIREESGRGLTATVGGRPVLMGRESWMRSHGIACGAHREDGLSVLHVARGGVWVGTVYLGDTMRAEAAEAGRILRDMGIPRLLMLTGDHRVVAEAIAAQVGITELRAECLPEDKQRVVNDLKNGGARVMVVGDGVNDAPALAAGDLGVAMGALGSDIAIQQADVALMHNDLARLPLLVALSRQAMRIINQNILYGVACILLAVMASSLGWVNPVGAAVIHEASVFLVILNSARLFRFDEPHVGERSHDA